MRRPILEVKEVHKSFKKSERQDLLVLEGVNFTMYEGEIIALLGKSGSGKSTLLRIIAGLVPPSKGDIIYRGHMVHEPVQGIAMVFQSFALMPWLTVLQNVELGLEALGVSREERRQRALKAIDIIGMDGFESAYPKELSGGMRQRVGFARALVVNPDILLMDEPFSALDVLTSDNLKSDLLDLWYEKKTKTSCILFVTHNIEEAVELADRIIIFRSDPGGIRTEVEVDIPHPRSNQDPNYRALVDKLYTLMTTSPDETEQRLLTGMKQKAISIGYRLPDVDLSVLTGLVEEIAEPEYAQRIDIPELAESLSLDVDNLLEIIEVLEILQFANIAKGDIELTPSGRRFAAADMLERKQIFASHLLRYVPLARRIQRILNERPSHRAPENRFLEELEDYLAEEEAERVLKVVIDWGRYAEIFAYDYNTGILSLDNPE